MDMARRRVDLRLDENFLARVDAEAERLGQTRTKFIERALEKALGLPSQGDAPGVGGESRVPGVSTPAPSRASAKGAVARAMRAEVDGGNAQMDTAEHELQGLRNIYETTADSVAASVTQRRAAKKPKPAAGGLPSIAPRHWGA